MPSLRRLFLAAPTLAAPVLLLALSVSVNSGAHAGPVAINEGTGEAPIIATTGTRAATGRSPRTAPTRPFSSLLGNVRHESDNIVDVAIAEGGMSSADVETVAAGTHAVALSGGEVADRERRGLIFAPLAKLFLTAMKLAAKQAIKVTVRKAKSCARDFDCQQEVVGYFNDLRTDRRRRQAAIGSDLPFLGYRGVRAYLPAGNPVWTFAMADLSHDGYLARQLCAEACAQTDWCWSILFTSEECQLSDSWVQDGAQFETWEFNDEYSYYEYQG